MKITVPSPVRTQLTLLLAAIAMLLSTVVAQAAGQGNTDGKGEVASAQAPKAIYFQGGVIDRAGNPLPDGTYNITFAFYDNENGGNQMWGETQTVVLKDGNFTTSLGVTHPLNLTFETSRWLAVTVAGADADTARTEFVIPTESNDAH